MLSCQPQPLSASWGPRSQMQRKILLLGFWVIVTVILLHSHKLPHAIYRFVLTILGQDVESPYGKVLGDLQVGTRFRRKLCSLKNRCLVYVYLQEPWYIHIRW